MELSTVMIYCGDVDGIVALSLALLWRCPGDMALSTVMLYCCFLLLFAVFIYLFHLFISFIPTTSSADNHDDNETHVFLSFNFV